ncbi:MAG: amidohydrolase family protein [Desulfatiglandales bacterium]|nr:amidohydrolase family protein [Desulfatiglandales bacterium]
MSSESKGSRTTTRTITLEEHFGTPVFIEGPGRWFKERPQSAQLLEKLCDLGDIRIADMDSAGIDMQVLSLAAPGLELSDEAEAIELARVTNDILADAVQRHPTRFAGFAILPPASPDTAADELERMVSKHNFKGAIINGHTKGRYLDDEFFWPILERAEALKVPIYLHPTQPPEPVIEAYYTGNFSAEVKGLLSTAGWGWHIETAVHVLRLILSGALDRYPSLQIIIGHLGEALPFMLPRINRNLPMAVTKLNRPLEAYLRENLHYTFAGFNFLPTFLDLLLQVGVSRIIFSADYPFGSMSAALAFLDQIPVSPADKESIAHGNAELLLGL